jgi:hypothetical protein
MRNKWASVLAACVGLLGVTSLGRAAPLLPGQDVLTPAPLAGTLGGPIATTGVGIYTFATAGGIARGDYVENVVRNRAGNPFGPGALSFEFFFDGRGPGSSSAVQALTVGDFAGVSTDVGWLPPPGTPSFAASRSSNGSGVAFLMAGGGVNPGEASAWLIIDTDATLFQPSFFSLAGDGGGTGALAALGPSPVPEPSSLALAGVGVAGLLGYGWRRWRKPTVG